MANKYRGTFVACFLSIVNQAIVTNVTAILFVPFMQLYGFQLWHLGLIVGINFGTQMIADIILTFIIDKVSFRKIAVFAVAFSVIGLVLYGLAPLIFPKSLIFVGILIATFVFAFSGGMLEVVISPIIDNIPNTAGGKGAAMSLMHSFYAWGQVATIIITSLSLFLFGFENWNYVLFFWALVPLVGLVMFFVVPVERQPTLKVKNEKKKAFLNKFFIAACFAIMFGGATEVIMNQWTSTYLQISFGFNKMTSDMVGMCLFAGFLGLGRAIYGGVGKKLNMNKVLVFGSGASIVLYLIAGLVSVPIIALIACVLCGFTSSLLWPGTLVVAADKFPNLGAWVFAVLAISGDIGGSVLSLVAGGISAALPINTTIAIMAVCPLIACLCHLYMLKVKTHDRKLLNETAVKA